MKNDSIILEAWKGFRDRFKISHSVGFTYGTHSLLYFMLKHLVSYVFTCVVDICMLIFFKSINSCSCYKLVFPFQIFLLNFIQLIFLSQVFFRYHFSSLFVSFFTPFFLTRLFSFRWEL